MTLTRAEYLAAFETWFRIAPVHSVEVAAAWPDAVAAGGLPDEGPVDAFCAVLEPRLPRGAVHFAIGKSSFLARALYGREPLRTVPCPEHKGEWSGVEMPADWPNTNACPHGCELTGWLPAVSR